jgi:2-haloacid dehalogenase
MTVKAVTFDAYGTLLRNEDLTLVGHRIVADHGLSTPVDEVVRVWIDLYHEATQQLPFRTLREIEGDILTRVLRRFGVGGDATPYVDLFFDVTTNVELYPEALEVMNGLGSVRAAIVSNADYEHLAAWSFKWPVHVIVISEAVCAYKPHPLIFERAVEHLGLRADEVLHVGDSEIDDVGGAKAAGLRVAWINRTGRARRSDLAPPDFEIRDLTELARILPETV